MQDQQQLTLDDVAGRLGVHYQTVYRWVRAGRLPAAKVGTSYIVEGSDLEVFSRNRTRPAPPPPPSESRLYRQQNAMAQALLEGDETKAQAIARQLISNGTSVTTLIERVIVPPLADIGARWHEGELPVYVEHRATAIVERLLGEISPNPRGRRRGRAVVAALAGDLHSLPTIMATACLREDHWHVDHLGANMPLTELEVFATDNDIDLAVVSVTTADRDLVEQAKETLEGRYGIPTLTGEPGATLTQLQTAARRALAGG